MIQVTNLAFSYTDEPLYEGVNFIIGDGQKIGIVGANGSGKSTLINIIAGREMQTQGKIKVIGKIAIVPQEIKHDPEIEQSKSINDDVDPENIHEDHKIKKLFAGLEIKLDLNSSQHKLSGDQKT